MQFFLRWSIKKWFRNFLVELRESGTFVYTFVLAAVDQIFKINIMIVSENLANIFEEYIYEGTEHTILIEFIESKQHFNVILC